MNLEKINEALKVLMVIIRTNNTALSQTVDRLEHRPEVESTLKHKPEPTPQGGLMSEIASNIKTLFCDIKNNRELIDDLNKFVYEKEEY